MTSISSINRSSSLPEFPITQSILSATSPAFIPSSVHSLKRNPSDNNPSLFTPILTLPKKSLSDELLKEKQELDEMQIFRRSNVLKSSDPIIINRRKGTYIDIPLCLGNVCLEDFTRSFISNLNRFPRYPTEIQDIRIYGSAANYILYDTPANSVNDVDISILLSNPPNSSSTYVFQWMKEIFIYTLSCHLDQEAYKELEFIGPIPPFGQTATKNPVTEMLEMHYLNNSKHIKDEKDQNSDWFIIGFGNFDFKMVVKELRGWSITAFSHQVSIETAHSYCLSGDRKMAKEDLEQKRFNAPDAHEMTNCLPRSLYELTRCDIFTWENLIPICINHLKENSADSFLELLRKHLLESPGKRKIEHVICLLEAISHMDFFEEKELILQEGIQLIFAHLTFLLSYSPQPETNKLLFVLTYLNRRKLIHSCLSLLKIYKDSQLSQDQKKSIFCPFLHTISQELSQKNPCWLQAATLVLEIVDFLSPSQRKIIFFQLAVSLKNSNELTPSILKDVAHSAHRQMTFIKSWELGSTFYSTIIKQILEFSFIEALDLFETVKAQAFSSLDQTFFYANFLKTAAERNDCHLEDLLELLKKNSFFSNRKNTTAQKQAVIQSIAFLFAHNTTKSLQLAEELIKESCKTLFQKETPDFLYLSIILSKEKLTSVRTREDFLAIIKNLNKAPQLSSDPAYEQLLQKTAENIALFNEKDISALYDFLYKMTLENNYVPAFRTIASNLLLWSSKATQTSESSKRNFFLKKTITMLRFFFKQPLFSEEEKFFLATQITSDWLNGEFNDLTLKAGQMLYNSFEGIRIFHPSHTQETLEILPKTLSVLCQDESTSNISAWLKKNIEDLVITKKDRSDFYLSIVTSLLDLAGSSKESETILSLITLLLGEIGKSNLFHESPSWKEISSSHLHLLIDKQTFSGLSQAFELFSIEMEQANVSNQELSFLYCKLLENSFKLSIDLGGNFTLGNEILKKGLNMEKLDPDLLLQAHVNIMGYLLKNNKYSKCKNVWEYIQKNLSSNHKMQLEEAFQEGIRALSDQSHVNKNLSVIAFRLFAKEKDLFPCEISSLESLSLQQEQNFSAPSNELSLLETFPTSLFANAENEETLLSPIPVVEKD